MKISVHSREEVVQGPLRVLQPALLISIRDAGKRKVKPCFATKAALFLEFDDAETGMPGNAKLMRDADVKAIWDFIAQQGASCAELVVQCEQGASRSPAVAMAIAKAHGENDWRRFEREFRPNQWVFEGMTEGVAQGR